MAELLSIRDISQELGIPQSTLRYYRDIFMEYLPSCGEGKKKRFFKEAVDVFAVIAKGMKQNKQAAEISAELNVKFTRVIEVDDKVVELDRKNKGAVYNYTRHNSAKSQDDSATNRQKGKNGQLQLLNTANFTDNETIVTVIRNQNKTIKEVAATMHMVNQHQMEIKNLKGEISKLEEQMEKQFSRHFQIIDSKLEQAVEKNSQKNKPKSFWQRMFG